MHVVHCVDAEGPLYESIDAKFDRLENMLGITGIERTKENFEKLMSGAIDVGNKKDLVKQVFSSHLSQYMDSWDKLDRMLSQVMSKAFRNKVTDSLGGEYVYSWFCIDHVGYDVNPRRRTQGYHAIFDHYRYLLGQQQGVGDGLHWHFHPMSTYREAHRCGNSLINSPHVFETLARRIIERCWFPSCVRAGFAAERPDTHWFFEQFIPFDFSNTSTEDSAELEMQSDLARGRFCDWRLAPKSWSVYHPSHDNYQKEGGCRRWIARALNVLNRFASINAYEVEKAFIRAQRGKPTILAITSHDYRDLGTEVDYFRSLLLAVQDKYPDVKFKFCDAREAIRAVAYGHINDPPLELKVQLHRDSGGKPHFLTIDTLAGQVFGPQPFLAIKTKSQRVIHDNLDFGTDSKSWSYVFDVETILPDDLSAVGVGANDKYGNTFVDVIWT